jgi:hypothetical protein
MLYESGDVEGLMLKVYVGLMLKYYVGVLCWGSMLGFYVGSTILKRVADVRS